jgi:hypothetical protein
LIKKHNKKITAMAKKIQVKADTLVDSVVTAGITEVVTVGAMGKSTSLMCNNES